MGEYEVFGGLRVRGKDNISNLNIFLMLFI